MLSSNNWRAISKPWFIAKLPSKCGSLMWPFQPTVVRGFSKYTRITICKFLACWSACTLSSLPYAMAWSWSWTEHEPTTITKRAA
jgi:hypothetical protein